jgi:hypothetical protein
MRTFLSCQGEISRQAISESDSRTQRLVCGLTDRSTQKFADSARMTRKPEVGRLQSAVAMSSLTILELAVGASGPTTGASFSILRLEQPHSIRRLLVSACLADSIQHIHALRASGVISSHSVNACGSDVSAFFKSARHFVYHTARNLFSRHR